MKQTFLLLFICTSLKVFSQPTDQILTRSRQLVAEKKYNTAFDILEKIDPKNANADIAIAKQDILLNYFVTSIMHKMFALKDLKPNEDVMDYRGKEGSYTMYAFSADSIFNSLIKTDSSNSKLYGALGNYYYDVYIHYGANWTESAETLFKYIEVNFKKVIEKRHADYMIFYELGYIEELQKKYAEATNYFLRSIDLNKNYANSWYNLAYAYLYQNDRSNAIKYAVKSIELYDDKSYKGDAARMTGEIYGELNDSKNEVYYYELSNKIDPGNYYTLKELLKIYVVTKNADKEKTLNVFYSLDPGNPTIYNELSEIYENGQAELINFYQGKLTQYINDKKVYGTINFYLAQLYISNDKRKAKACLIKAKTSLSEVLPKDNGVFKAIDALMEKSQ